MTLPTWDLFITLFFFVSVAYGFILGRNRIAATLISTYVGLAVASEVGRAFGSTVLESNLLNTNLAVSTNASDFVIKIVVFAAVVVLVSLKGDFSVNAERGPRSAVVTALYAFLNAGLIVSSLMLFMTPESREVLFGQSALAEKVFSYRTWWLILPVVIMVADGIMRGRRPAE